MKGHLGGRKLGIQSFIIIAIIVFALCALVIAWLEFAGPIIRKSKSNLAANSGALQQQQQQQQCNGETGLWDWAMRNGAQAPKIQFGNFSYEENGRQLTRRGLIAKSKIKQSEWYIKVPLSEAISVRTALRSRIGHVIGDLLLEGNWEDFDMITLYLLWERRNPPSPIFHYLCTLPTSFTTTMFWNDKKLREYDPSLAELTEARKEAWKDAYAQKFVPLMKLYPDLFQPHDYPLTYYLWGASVVLSRNWVVPRTKDSKMNSHLLVPLADMVNHKVGGGYVNIDWEGGYFYVHAGQDYEKGDEIFLSYGEKCNRQLLLDYGFSEDGNKLKCH